MIEVKGKAEGWETYNWQDLYPSEVECLRKNPSKFFLYIVKFSEKAKCDLYIIPATDLIEKFNIKIAAYSLTPISRTRLREFLQPASKHRIAG